MGTLSHAAARAGRSAPRRASRRLSACAVKAVAYRASDRELLPLPFTGEMPVDPVLVLVWDAHGWLEPAACAAIERWAQVEEEQRFGRLRSSLQPVGEG